jgi:hypothetical protein
VGRAAVPEGCEVEPDWVLPDRGGAAAAVDTSAPPATVMAIKTALLVIASVETAAKGSAILRTTDAVLASSCVLPDREVTVSR